jgi:hypothetical protein
MFNTFFSKIVGNKKNTRFMFNTFFSKIVGNKKIHVLCSILCFFENRGK